MDQFVVEVTHIDDVLVGDEVVALGRQGKEVITPEEVADWADTNNYEIVTGLLPQVVRAYKQNGYYSAPSEGVEQWANYLRAV